MRRIALPTSLCSLHYTILSLSITPAQQVVSWYQNVWPNLKCRHNAFILTYISSVWKHPLYRRIHWKSIKSIYVDKCSLTTILNRNAWLTSLSPSSEVSRLIVINSRGGIYGEVVQSGDIGRRCLSRRILISFWLSLSSLISPYLSLIDGVYYSLIGSALYSTAVPYPRSVVVGRTISM